MIARHAPIVSLSQGGSTRLSHGRLTMRRREPVVFSISSAACHALDSIHGPYPKITTSSPGRTIHPLPGSTRILDGYAKGSGHFTDTSRRHALSFASLTR